MAVVSSFIRELLLALLVLHELSFIAKFYLMIKDVKWIGRYIVESFFTDDLKPVETFSEFTFY